MAEQKPPNSTHNSAAAPPPIVQQPGSYTPNQYGQPPNMGFGQQPPNMGFGQQPPNMGFGQQPPNMGFGQQPGFQNPHQPGFPAAPPPFIAPLPSVPGVPIGLEAMISLGHLFVKQRVELLEIIAQIETANKYDVFDGNGQRVYYAAETTHPGMVVRGGPNRPFVIDIIDFAGRRVLNLQSEGCAGSMFVTLGDGSRLGEITHPEKCKPNFGIVDETGEVMLIKGPPPCCGCCINTLAADFTISTKEGGVPLGVIRKSFAGYIQERISDADNFGVEFPPDLNVRWKALMFAAVFPIDFIYFESSARRDTHRHGHHHL